MNRIFLASALLLSISAAQVDTAWVRTYGGYAGGYDSATCVAVDREQNVVVTGVSYGVNTSADYVTVKYNPQGETVWTRRYWYSAAPYEDLPWAMAVDSVGSVYVTGSSCMQPSTGNDYATVKYSADGVRRWVSRYDGPASSMDEATALAIDRLGNVYVTGNSQGANGWTGVATIKYDSLGQEQWVTRHDIDQTGNFASALAVDDSGCVYVTGVRSDVYNYVTVKYGPNGGQRWAVEYNGPGDDIDIALGVALDSNRNVYVCGYSKNVNGDHDFATVKYNAAGVQQWAARYNGPGNYTDAARDIAVSRAGMVYVTGSSIGEDGDYDFATVKYDTNGDQLWVARYNGQGSGSDMATQLDLDAQENVYVTGISGYGTAVVKYNSAGDEEWAVTHESRCPAVAADGIGGACVAGILGGDFVTIKFSTATGTKEEEHVPGTHPAQPTLVRREYRLGSQLTTSIFDASGRKVANPQPGTNAAGTLTPGVYFVAPPGAEAPSKLVVVR